MTGPAAPGWSRARAEEADRDDPLARFRGHFVVDPAAPIYLDGNSLGRLPRATAGELARFMDEWAQDLVGGWERWAGLSAQVGERVASLVGAGPGQVTVSDSTTVNLYKLAVAALGDRPGRPVVVGDAHDFPTVRYVLQGLADEGRCQLRLVDSDPVEGPSAAQVAELLEGRAALVCLSAVNFRSGAVADMAAINAASHQAGALALWDLCHAAGVLPLQLDAWGTDLAVGCGYKYLNGGPGAPAWLYVRAGLQARLRQPIWGWWGHAAPFEMGPSYRPAPGVGRFMTGTPPVMGTLCLDAGLAPLLEAGMDAVWAKTRRLMALLASRVEAELVPLGARVASPADPARRGGHLALSHPQAWEAARLLIEGKLVVPDFRPPDVLRLAPAAIYTRYAEVYDAVAHIASALDSPEVLRPLPRRPIT